MLAQALQNPQHGEMFVPIVEDIFIRIREHLDAARLVQSSLPAIARPAFSAVVSKLECNLFLRLMGLSKGCHGILFTAATKCQL